MDYQLDEARTHRCRRIPFFHPEFQERQLSCQTRYSGADFVVVAVAVAELVEEEAMQMVTNPEDACFWHRRTRWSFLCSGLFAGSGVVGIVQYSPWLLLPKPPRIPVA